MVCNRVISENTRHCIWQVGCRKLKITDTTGNVAQYIPNGTTDGIASNAFHYVPTTSTSCIKYINYTLWSVNRVISDNTRHIIW